MAEQEAATAAEEREAAAAELVGADAEQVVIQMEPVSAEQQPAARKSRDPIDAFPEQLIFVARVLGLLRGLASSLKTRHSYLETMTPFAKQALKQARVIKQESKDEVNLLTTLKQPVCDVRPLNVLEQKLHTILEGHKQAGRVMGAQVCVRRHGEVCVDIAYGLSSPYQDDSIVQHDTLFNAFSVTKAVVATLVHLAVDRGKLKYSDAVSTHWPGFGANGKSEITVKQVLLHQSKLQHAGSDHLGTTPFTLTDWPGMLKQIEESKPAATTAYHYLSFGYILGGLLEKVTGRTVAQLVSEWLAVPLQVENEFTIGITDECEAELAVVTSMAEPEQERQLDSQAQFISQGSQLTGPLLLLGPSLFNHAKFRAATIPGANGHFTARALAKLYTMLAASSGYAHEDLLANVESKIGSHGMVFKQSLTDLVDDGRMYGFEKLKLGEHTLAFGHSGIGGSFAFCDPVSGLAVAIVINKLTLGYQPTQDMLKTICNEFGLGSLRGAGHSDNKSRGNDETRNV